MAKSQSYLALSESYRVAWESCVALWPILVLRFIYLILNAIAFIFCLFIGFWPLIQALWNGFKSGPENFEGFARDFNWSGYFMDLHWVVIAVGLFLLFITWWSFLASLFDGAVYRQLSEHQKNGTDFSLPGFFKSGLRYMFSMMGVQLCWGLIFIGVSGAGGMIALIAAVLLKLLGLSWWIMILLSIPAALISILLCLYLGVSASITGAYLVNDHGIFDSIKSALIKCKENGGRVIWIFLLAFIIYFVFSLASSAVLSALAHIPWVGWVFSLIDLIVGLILGLGVSIYVPSLAVAFQLEEKA